MNQLYFRDFLSKFIDLGGDISKITFVSSSLANKYEIRYLGRNHLECTRISFSGKRDNASFHWGDSKIRQGVYSSYCVKAIGREASKVGLVGGNNKVIVTLVNTRESSD